MAGEPHASGPNSSCRCLPAGKRCSAPPSSGWPRWSRPSARSSSPRPIRSPTCERTAPSVPRDNIVIEPQARNTARLHRPRRGRGPAPRSRRRARVVPSDQYAHDARRPIAPFSNARSKLRAAASSSPSASGRPRPETGFGYIEMGAETERGARVVERFVEKPDLPTAERYLASGATCGTRACSSSPRRRILEAIRAHLPELGAHPDAIAARPGARRRALPAARRRSRSTTASWRSSRAAKSSSSRATSAGTTSAAGARCRRLRRPTRTATPSSARRVTVDARGNILYGDAARCIAAVGVRTW